MLAQPRDALGHGLGLPARVDEPVPHAGERHRQLRHLVQAAQIVSQRIRFVGKRSHVGRAVHQHVIAVEHDLPIGQVQALVSRRVPRRLHRPHPVAAVAHLVPVGQVHEALGHGPFRARDEAGIGALELVQLVRRKALERQPRLHRAAIRARAPAAEHLLVARAQVHLRILVCKRRDQSQVVDVEVRGEHVGARHVYAQILQRRTQHLVGRLMAHAGVHQQVALVGGDEVGVRVADGRAA